MSTEQVRNFPAVKYAEQACPKPQKGALYPAQIQDHNRHGNHMRSRLLQLCRHQSHATLAFRQTEATLYFHTIALVYMRLPLIRNAVFLRPAERWAGEPDVALLAVCQIVPVPVYLVREVMPFTLVETFRDVL